MHIDLHLRIYTGRDKSFGMTDWIDKSNERYIDEQNRRLENRRIFDALATRKWQAFVSQITRDAEKLSRSSLPRIKGKMEVNNRDPNVLPRKNHPSGPTLYVDNEASPAIYLDITLDSDTESIHLHQVRKEADESNAIETDERIILALTSNGDYSLVMKDADGRVLSIEGLSEYVLGRFLDR